MGMQVNLSGKILIGVTISEVDVRVYDLTGADLTGATLIEVDLEGANLPGANLSGADLSKSYLSGANLRGAIYDAYTVFPHGFTVVGKGMILNNTIKHTNGTDHTWCKAHGVNKSNIADRSNALLDNGKEIDLSDAVLYRAKLEGANLTRAILTRAILIRADLTKARLAVAYLDGTDLTEANLTEADLIWAIYNSDTKFPEGFGDPKSRYMIFQE